METWRRNLYILMISQFLVMSAMSMIMPFLPLYLKEMGVTDPADTQRWAGLIFGINFLTAFIFAPIWGSLGDRYGRKIMILRSGFGMAIIIFLTGLATSPLQLFFLRLLNGTVSGFIPASISLLATSAPKEKVGYALGMLQSGAVAGSIMGPFIGGVLAEVIGFRNIFFLTAIVLAIATFIVLFAVQEEFVPVKKNQKSQGFWKDTSMIFHIRPLLILFVVGIFMQFAMVGIAPQMSLFVDQLGVPGGYVAFFAGLVTAAAGIATMVSSPLLGKVSDRFGAEKVMFLALIGAALLFIPHYFVLSVWQLLILRFILGLFVGGLTPSLSALIRQYAPKGKESTAFGYNTSAIFLGNLLGPITYGVISGFIGIRGIFLVTAGLLFGVAIWLKMGLHVNMKPLAQSVRKSLKNTA
ncbi:MFS transporter [Hazenella coriacea]|uniref:DHA1 family multidrug resistance protein-like MFS transporter n=1 Tax=Hazenella coriacea TaxID=1179467 RepID=A0A4R3L5P1_9BACL|nr:MFS transporter [Hazenella coriacea]TCS95013.1 DHA1 family multidrug resistance protein-like MFS transporter [Hazenella coriacea]